MKIINKKTLIASNIMLIGILTGLSAGLLIDRAGRDFPKQAEAASIDSVDLQYTFRTVAEEALPFVVEIMTVDVRVQEMPKGYSWPFNFIEPEEDGKEPEQKEYETEGLGSGIIVGKDENKYYVLTNNHVIADADRISVRLFDRRIIQAGITGVDERKDLALLSFESNDALSVAELGDSDELHVGDLVLAVGSPLGYESTVTAGIVSALGRSGPEDNISDFIQTDASINQGNSGGALVNLNGEVVGINTWIATTTGVSIGLGFSIPINNVKKAIDDFIKSGSVQYGWLGVAISEPDELTAEQLEIENRSGALIYNVYKDSPAGRAGLMPGDFVISVDGTPVENYRHFTRLIGDVTAGQKIEITLVRQKTELTLTALIELRKDNNDLIMMYGSLWPGFKAVPLNDKMKQELGLQKAVQGAIISVDAGTAAFDAGLKNFDIITEINGVEINNMLDFYAVINDKSSNYKFKIIRNSAEMLIELKL